MIIVYRLAMKLALMLGQLLAFAAPKVREFIFVRQRALSRWEQRHDLIGAWWFHVSSVGELEQVRPVMEAFADKKILLTYFSPSVPRLVKDWGFAKAADFCPLDTAAAMETFFRAVRPKILILNRYDLWPEMLERAQRNSVPVALINASTPPQGFWGRWSLWIRRSLFKKISIWTYVDSDAAAAWEPFVRPHSKGMVTGNPRVDRALERVEAKMQSPSLLIDELKTLADGRPVLVGGSTWEEDEELLLKTLLRLREERPLFFLVPHEPNDGHVKKILELGDSLGLKGAALEDRNQDDLDFLVVNTRGILAELYALGSIAHVGGGFGRHVHSVIEPLAHGVVVSLGPRHERAPEVAALIALGAAFVAQHPRHSVDSLAELCLDAFRQGERSRKAREALGFFVKIHRGAGERIALFLQNEGRT